MKNDRRVAAILVAGGKGERMRSQVRKQYVELGGLPIMTRALHAFDRCQAVDHIVLVIPERDRRYCRDHVLAPLQLRCPPVLVAGGKKRQHSVYNGICAIEKKVDVLVVHDAVRPFVTTDQISACIEQALACGACILAMPASDTVKRVSESGLIAETLPRERIWLAQTPQAFSFDLIKQAHELYPASGAAGTDDAVMVERLGVAVRVIKGSRTNIKITTPGDLLHARALIESGAVSQA